MYSFAIFRVPIILKYYCILWYLSCINSKRNTKMNKNGGQKRYWIIIVPFLASVFVHLKIGPVFMSWIIIVPLLAPVFVHFCIALTVCEVVFFQFHSCMKSAYSTPTYQFLSCSSPKSDGRWTLRKNGGDWWKLGKYVSQSSVAKMLQWGWSASHTVSATQNGQNMEVG